MNRRPADLKRGTIARGVIVLAAIVAALVPLPQRGVENWYSNGLYPVLQSLLTPISNRVPFALLDLAAGAVIVAALLRMRRRVRRLPAARALRGIAADVVVFASAAYLLFLVTWGFNYRRVPLEQKLQYEAPRITREAALAVGYEAVRHVNELYLPAHNADGADPSLESAFAEAQRLMGSARGAAAGVPKRSLLTMYFRWAAIDGMTDPFFLEIIVNPEVLPIERPFVVAHEWAHLAGYADEAEANFLAWLTCVRGDRITQYSGWLSLHQHIVAALRGEDRRTLTAALDPGPREDVAAMAARFERSAPPVRYAARQVYDSYLRANRVHEGIGSYDAVVRLVLGTSFENGWVPRLRRNE